MSAVKGAREGKRGREGRLYDGQNVHPEPGDREREREREREMKKVKEGKEGKVGGDM